MSSTYYVTSLDVGFRKPHPAMFERALEALGVRASDATMVGDSPGTAIVPAKSLGLRTVLVAIQTDPADHGDADVIVSPMDEPQTTRIGARSQPTYRARVITAAASATCRRPSATPTR